ncbi:MAG TPA: hypothetical protein VMU93_07450 [Caulobacteraceae bacterium]|nr:hypothetical protein [Caulobacteraceae bacterium]
MPPLERMISLRGPRFFRDGERLMFVNHLDGSTRDGPRPATQADRAAHPDAAQRDEAAGARSGLGPRVTFTGAKV